MENSENKIFTIAGREFEFKDLTIDEDEEVKKYTSKANVSGKEFIVNFTGAETKRFLYLILAPLDGKAVDEAFFGKVLHKDFIEIFITFFFMNDAAMMRSVIKYAQSILLTAAQLSSSKA
jgi:hypothetical protein